MTDDEIDSGPFIEEQRAWLKAHKAETGLSGAEIAKRTATKEGTITNFYSDRGYAGRELPLAEAVQRYRQQMAARTTTFVDAPDIPGYFETATSTELLNLLHWAQRGKMVYAPLGSGLGKSMAAHHFATLYPHVYIVTIPPSCGSPGPMQQQVLEALGVSNASGTPRSLSRLICARLAAMHRPVLILDEAQELTVKALEEVRSWYDEIGCGIALLGDQRLSQTINNGAGKQDLPQLRSRLKRMPARVQPYAQDVLALAAAWNVQDKRMILELSRIAQKPGALRLTTGVLEGASLLATGREEVLALGHIQEAAADALRQERVS